MAGSQLKKRGTVYYARQVVPVDLQHVMGRRELARSLNTHERRTAKVRLLDVRGEWERQFADLRRRREMTEADFAAATWQHYSSELSHDGAERAAGGISPPPKWREYQLRALRAHLGRGETVSIEWAADAYIEQHQLLVERDTNQYRELCFRLMRAQIEAIERASERDAGVYSGEPADPIVTRPAATAEVAKPGETITELFNRYAKENPKQITEAALTQASRDIGTFVELVGTDFPASKIDKKSVREWKGLLQAYPVKAAEIAIFKGKSFREIIDANAKAEEPKRVIVAKTVNRYMAGFGAFCNWLAAHDYIAANPFTDMYLSVDKTKTSTKTFTPEQLKLLFGSPLFTGCQSDMKWHAAGAHLIRDHRYWLPHIMMYSGARPGEIAQLLIDDVREMHGQWVMQITDEGDDTKRVKTKGSFRVVPIHSELVKLGFIELHQRMKAQGETRLFREAERSVSGQIAAKFEKKFGTYLTKLGIKDGRGLSLYSFRHGFADAMRRAEYMDDEFGFLMGHSKHSMTERYGQLPQGTLKKRVELIEAVRYEL